MSTYVIYNSNNGEAVSIGTIVSDPLPEGLISVAISDIDADKLRLGTGIWSPNSLSVVDVILDTPPEDPLTVLLSALSTATTIEQVQAAAAAAQLAQESL